MTHQAVSTASAPQWPQPSSPHHLFLVLPTADLLEVDLQGCYNLLVRDFKQLLYEHYALPIPPILMSLVYCHQELDDNMFLSTYAFAYHRAAAISLTLDPTSETSLLREPLFVVVNLVTRQGWPRISLLPWEEFLDKILPEGLTSLAMPVDVVFTFSFKRNASGLVVYTPALLRPDDPRLPSIFFHAQREAQQRRKLGMNGQFFAAPAVGEGVSILLLQITESVAHHYQPVAINAVGNLSVDGLVDSLSWRKYTQTPPVPCQVHGLLETEANPQTLVMKPLQPLRYHCHYALYFPAGVVVAPADEAQDAIWQFLPDCIGYEKLVFFQTERGHSPLRERRVGK